MISLLMLVYRFLFMPILLTLFFIGTFFNAKLRRSFQLRKRSAGPNALQYPVWIHAASGEFEYAKSVIREIKRQSPATKILVTFFSPSFADAVSKFPGVDHAEPLPFDLPGPVNEFLSRHRPSCLLISRSDLWPELLLACKTRNLPVLLFSCTRPPARISSVFTGFIERFLYSLLTDIFCVSESDLLALQALKVTSSLRVAGDTRYDQVTYRLNNPKPIRDNLFLNPSTKTLVAGSVWPEDWDQIVRASEEMLRAGTLRLIVVPHELQPSFLTKIKSDLTQRSLGFDCYETAQSWTTPVLLVDRVGILAELYPYGDAAFVGGSFKKKVHSVMEPLAAGLMTYVGPFHKNNREAVEFQRVVISQIDSKELTGGFSAVQVVASATDFKNTLARDLNAKRMSTETRAAVQNEVKKRQGATIEVLRWLESRNLLS